MRDSRETKMKEQPLPKERMAHPPSSTGHTSYILAEVESSDNGADKFANYLLTIADCRRSIRLEFFLGTKENRRRSLKKINLLIDTLTRFRDALKRESDLIDKFK
jgi:hypothetical protein